MSKTRIAAIAIKQPQATLIAHSFVRFITFPFRKNYSGLIAIYAEPLTEMSERHANKPPQSGMIKKLGYLNTRSLPHNSIVGFAHLAGMVRTEALRPKLIEQGATRELLMSDWADGRWAWLFTQCTAITQPIYVQRPNLQPFFSPLIRKELIYKYTYH